MARYTEAVCRQCRREGAKLFLKGDRCYSDKCAFAVRSYAPAKSMDLDTGAVINPLLPWAPPMFRI